MSIRPLRITGIAGALMYLFHLSRKAGAALGNEEAPGLLVAVAIVSLLFSIRAVVTEKTMGAEATGQKDFPWGVSLGGWATIALRLLTDR